MTLHYVYRMTNLSSPTQVGLASRSQTLAGWESLVNYPYKTCSNTHPNWSGQYVAACILHCFVTVGVCLLSDTLFT